MKTTSPASSKTVRLITLAALGSVLFTAGVGFFLFRNTRNLAAAGKWVQHTQEVQLSLQSALFLTQRIDLENRLYRFDQDEEQLNNARKDAIQLQTSVSHLKTLVSDNDSENGNIKTLEVCSSGAIDELGKIHPEPAPLNRHLLQCRRALSLMSNEERELLQQRDDASRRSSQISILTELAVGILCFAVLLTLFALLLRDAILRNRIALLTQKTNDELNTSVRTLQDHARDSELLAIARDDLQLCTDQQQVHQSAALRFSELLPGTCGAICIINSSRNMVERVASWGCDSVDPHVSEIFPPDTCCGLRSGRLRWYGPGASQIHCTHFTQRPPDRYLCLPLVAHGDTIGILSIEFANEATQRAAEDRMGGVQQLIQLTAMALASLQMRQELEHQSVRDGLTGLFNRHFLEIALQRELARAVRRKTTLAVLMIDVDHFKRLNDQFGHAAGDAVLKEVAHVFGDKIRTDDLACRYGGEEFTIILPEITPEIAFQRAEIIRQAVADLRTRLDNTLYNSVTISIGAAMFPQDGTSAELLLRHADAALYRAKHEGRNRVVMNLSEPHALTSQEEFSLSAI
ncbi:MAG TPA: diguanylate cyclase [Edaphobacter sp.]|nr:diguanylate cyclase [Edaphobacter sp.]